MVTTANRTYAPLALIASILSLQCSNGEHEVAEARFEERDSVGIVVAISRAPTPGERQIWRVSDSPELQIGRGADTAALFQSVRQAARFHDGRIAVVDRHSYAVRQFAADGKHVATLGRRGGGPGEFEDDPLIAIAADGRVVVWDQRNRRMTIFGTNGSIESTSSLVSVMAHLSVPTTVGGTDWRLRHDGVLLSIARGRERPLGDDATEVYRRPLLLAGDSIAELPAVSGWIRVRTQREDGTFLSLTHDLAGTGSIAFGGGVGGVTVLPRDRGPQLEFHDDDGRLRRIVRLAERQMSLDGALLAAHTERLSQVATRMGTAERVVRQAFRSVSLPDSVLPFTDHLHTSDGFVWIARRRVDMQQPLRFEIIDRSGHWRGHIDMPASAGRVLEVGEDYVLTSATDHLNVPFVQLFTLHPPRQASDGRAQWGKVIE